MIRGVAKLRTERTCDVSLKVIAPSATTYFPSPPASSIHCEPRLVPSNSSTTKHSVVGAGDADGAGVIVGDTDGAAVVGAAVGAGVVDGAAVVGAAVGFKLHGQSRLCWESTGVWSQGATDGLSPPQHPPSSKCEL